MCRVPQFGENKKCQKISKIMILTDSSIKAQIGDSWQRSGYVCTPLRIPLRPCPMTKLYRLKLRGPEIMPCRVVFSQNTQKIYKQYKRVVTDIDENWKWFQDGGSVNTF